MPVNWAGGHLQRRGRRLGVARAIAGLALLAASDVPALALPDRALGPTLPNGIDLFRTVCLEASFGDARTALRAFGVETVEIGPLRSIWAQEVRAGHAFLRGDPGAKSADDIVITVGEGAFDGVALATCSTFSFVTPRMALDAFGLPLGTVARPEPVPGPGSFGILPPVLGVWFVPGERGVAALTVSGRLDEPGTILSLDTATPWNAARIAAALAHHSLFETPLPAYDDALGRLTARPEPETRPGSTP